MRSAKRLNRRDFLRLAAVTATGALVAACAPAATEVIQEAATEEIVRPTVAAPTVAPTKSPLPTEAPTLVPTEVPVEPTEEVNPFIAKIADVLSGSSVDFTYKEKPGILVNIEGEYKAYVNVCTHNGCQTKFAGKSLNCPCHGSRFEAATGEVLQGPAAARLRKIKVFLEGDSVYFEV